MHISPNQITAAANAFDKLAGNVDELPMIHGDAAAAKLSGCAIGTALDGADAASLQAKAVMKGRFQELSNLLTHTMTSIANRDADVADKIGQAAADGLAGLDDFNAGDAHATAPTK